jgi:ATP-dependent helicase/nuclease subunit B
MCNVSLLLLTLMPVKAPRQLCVSSDATRRLEAAREWVKAFPTDTPMLILSARGIAADALIHSTLGNGAARLGVHRFTPNRLASVLAEPILALKNTAPASPLTLTAVVTRAVYRVVSENRAGPLGSVAQRPGFPRALTRTFEELRAAGVTIEALRAAKSRNSEQVAVFVEAILKELEETQLADRAHIYEIAIAQLAERDAPFAGLPLLLLDLPLNDGLDERLIAAITGHAPKVLATAVQGDHAATQALARILQVAGKEPSAPATPSSLVNLQSHLFEDSTPAERPLDDTVSLASWPGESRECIEIARRMQQEAARGVPFDRMAVLLRAPSLYRAHLEEALRRASIPVWFARGSTRPDTAGRALLALLACGQEGLTARRFAEYLSLAQVPEEGAKAEDAWTPPELELLTPRLEPSESESEPEQAERILRTPWRWERLLADAAVIGGADRWRRRIEGLRTELTLRQSELQEEDARSASLERTREHLKALRDFALPVIERLAALPKAAPWGDWLEQLSDLVAAALRRPASVLQLLAELEPLRPVGPVDLATVQFVLSQRLRELTVAPQSRPHGAVFVAPIESARGLTFDVVFVPGLAEKLFPQRVLQDPLLPDETRKALGAPLPTLDSRVAEERLALRLAANAAVKHLALSWPRIETEQARPRVPSFYALEALRAAEGRLPGLDELTNRAERRENALVGWPAPKRPDEAIDETEYDLAVLAQLKEADPEKSVGAAAYLLGANPHLARALRARARRWRRGWSYADGLVDAPADALAALATHRIGARVYSATALESFAVCPYRFLLQAIHQLRPREEIEALETLDPLTRGAIIHEIQFSVLSQLHDAKALPIAPVGLEFAFGALDATLNRIGEAYRERLAPAIPRVWQDALEAIRLDLREWLRQMSADPSGWTPMHFELSFGLPPHLRKSQDPASRTDPVPILGSASLRGSIDLIERNAEQRLRVTDYKSGKVRVEEGAVVGGGQVLQPILYALAAEKILGSAVQSSRLYYCTADGEYTERYVLPEAPARAHAATALQVIDRAIEQGFLPAAPVKDACDRCNYRVVCGPHEGLRVSRKRDDRLADLKSLRELP